MLPVDNYHQCQDCGATWNQQPKPGPAEVVLEDTAGRRGMSPYRPTRYRPTDAVIKRRLLRGSGKP